MGGRVLRAGAAAIAAGIIGAVPLVASAGDLSPGYGGSGPAVHNPCHGKLGRLLRCPNLRIGPPQDLYVTRGEYGKVLLHSTTDIKSRGEGPMELRGKRTGRKAMSVRQVIHTRRGGRRSYRTNGHLIFWYIPGQGPYWKFHFAARFELWRLGPHGRRRHLIRIGPKLNYCLRDLERTKPSRKSPRNPVYPGCSQDPGARHRTLGTSVGWSDIYPTTYYQNWINVKGLRGCFAFVLRVDPRNLLYENRENDNTRGRHVRLPIHGSRIRGCRR